MDPYTHTEIKFGLLGPLSVNAGSQRVRVIGERQRRLLGLLLLGANSIMSFDRLIDELWDEAPKTARQQLFNSVAALRRVPGLTAHISTSYSGYEFTVEPGKVDALRFIDTLDSAQHALADGRSLGAAGLLADALRLWRGPVLTDVQGRWVEGQAAWLTEQRLIAAEQLAAVQLDLPGPARGVGDLLQLVAENPLRESLRSKMMLILHRQGRLGDAVSLYQQGRKALREELGLDPGQEMQRTFNRILHDA
jgi:DNA-binding SARP family transcriptional activator